MSDQVNPSLEDPFLSVTSVAKIFDVEEAQVRMWIKDGKMNGNKILGRWRVLQSEVNRVANEEYGG